MRDAFEGECQELRSRIARSRRRLDRRARQLAEGGLQLLPWQQFVTRGSSGAWMTALATGFALSGQLFGSDTSQHWRQQLLGTAVSNWLDRLARRLRVLARQYRRGESQPPPDPQEETVE